MRVTNKTKYDEFVAFERFLSDEGKAQLMKGAETQFGTMYDLEFAQFYSCANGDFSEVLGDMRKPTVLQVYWAKRFEQFVGEFTEVLKGLTLPPTDDETAAAVGLIKTNWGENMLVFLQRYFGLKSFKEAEKITIGELLIAKRAQYNQDKMRRNLMQIQLRKMKAKK